MATWAAFPISGGLVDHISATTFKRWKRFAKPHHVGDLGDLAGTQCKNFQAQGSAMSDGDLKD